MQSFLRHLIRIPASLHSTTRSAFSRRLFIGMLLMSSVALVQGSEMGGKMKSYAVQNLSFTAPEAGIKVSEAGTGVFNIELADPSSPDASGAWITVYFPSAEALKAMPDPLASFKSTYLGTAKPAEKQVTREVMGKTLTGDWQQTKIPKKLVLEAYRLDISASQTVFIGYRRNPNFDEAAAEAFFKAVSSSLKAN